MAESGIFTRSNVLAVLLGLGLTVIVLEVFGRVSPVNLGFQSSAGYLRFHEQLGFEIDPAIGRIDYRNACVSTEVNFDANGLRSEAVAAEADGPRIAVLGDSFMTGREVNDQEHFTAFLTRSLGTGDAINFGVPAYGTLQGYVSWEVKARDYRPDITVLSFLEVNDVENNSEALSGHTPIGLVRPFLDAETGEIVYPTRDLWNRQLAAGSSPVHGWLSTNSFTYFVGHRVWAVIAGGGGATVEEYGKDAGTDAQWWERSPLLLHAGVFENPPQPAWESAWEATEFALTRLQSATAEDGGKLLVMYLPRTGSSFRARLPEIFETDAGMEMPDSVDLDYPFDRLSGFAAEQGIDFLDLDRNFAPYAERHGLEKPFYYYRCDGHMNPLGHYLAAYSVLEYLLEQGWLADSDLKNPEFVRSRAFMELSPAEVLGEDAAKVIYGWGPYLGNSIAGER